jgi:hypothetical protein
MAAATPLVTRKDDYGSWADFLVVFYVGGASARNVTKIFRGVAKAFNWSN